MKWRARFRAMADFPEPQTPRMKISLLPFSISVKTSWTMSAWVLLLEKVRGARHSPASRIEFEFTSFLCRDHMG